MSTPNTPNKKDRAPAVFFIYAKAPSLAETLQAHTTASSLFRVVDFTSAT